MFTLILARTATTVIGAWLLFIPFLGCGSDGADWQEKMRVIEPRGYLCRRATAPIVVDGKLDEAAWEQAPWSDEFVDIQGEAKPKPRFRTSQPCF